MTIGFFLQSYSIGGVNTFLINLLNNIPKNIDIYLYYNNDNPGIKILKKNLKRNIKFIKYKIFSLDQINIFQNLKFLNFIFRIILTLCFPLIFYYQYTKIKKLFLKFKIDDFMSVNGGYPGGDLSRISSIVWGKLEKEKKSWHNFHNLAVKRNRFFLTNFYRNIIDKILQNSINGFITVSKSCAESLKQRKYLNKPKIKIVYNGFAPGKIKFSDIRKELKIKSNSSLLLFLGEYDLRKGHELIIKVMDNIVKENKDIYLLICGYGSKTNFSNIKEIVDNSYSKNKIFLKNFRKDNLNLISQCDLLVIPSKNFESFGYTAIEAMSLKKPVISTNIGGLKEVIDHNTTGFIISGNNHKLFAEKVLLLLKNHKLRKSFSEKGYKRYRKYFSSEIMTKKYLNTIITDK